MGRTVQRGKFHPHRLFRRRHAARSVGRVGEFIAELYVARADEAGAEGLSRRVRAAAEELTREGRRQLAEEQKNWERLAGAVARVLAG